MRRLVASPQRASLLTPRSEPATPSFATVNGAEPEPEPESGPSPIGGTAPMGTVYLLEKVPMLTDLYHTMGGTILIRQAIQRGGGASLWSEDMKSEIKSVIVESMPGRAARRTAPTRSHRKLLRRIFDLNSGEI